MRLLLGLALGATFNVVPASRPMEVPIHFQGTYTVQRFAANGYDARKIDAAQYESFAKSKSCLVGSALGVWPRSKTVVLVCEL